MISAIEKQELLKTSLQEALLKYESLKVMGIKAVNTFAKPSNFCVELRNNLL